MFISVYRLAIDAKTRQGMMEMAETPELAQGVSDSYSINGSQRHLHQSQGVYIVFVFLCARYWRELRNDEDEGDGGGDGGDKNHDNPLEEDGGIALLLGFRFGLLRARLLTPETKA